MDGIGIEADAGPLGNTTEKDCGSSGASHHDGLLLAQSGRVCCDGLVRAQSVREVADSVDRINIAGVDDLIDSEI